MPEETQKTLSIETAAFALSQVSDQLCAILAQLDTIAGAEIVAIRIEEAIGQLEALTALNSLRGLDKPPDELSKLEP